MLASLITELVTVDSIHIPDTNIMAVGPITLTLSNVGRGNGIGGLSGSLISAGFISEQANLLEDALLKANAILLIHAENKEDAAKAESILRYSGGILKAA